MILASDVKEGTALRLDGKIWKVLEVVHHAGSGQMHGFIELKLHDVQFGHFGDKRFKHADRRWIMLGSVLFIRMPGTRLRFMRSAM